MQWPTPMVSNQAWRTTRTPPSPNNQLPKRDPPPPPPNNDPSKSAPPFQLRLFEEQNEQPQHIRIPRQFLLVSSKESVLLLLLSSSLFLCKLGFSNCILHKPCPCRPQFPTQNQSCEGTVRRFRSRRINSLSLLSSSFSSTQPLRASFTPTRQSQQSLGRPHSLSLHLRSLKKFVIRLIR